jgi:hypothetical protein
MARRGRETGALIKYALDGIIDVYPAPATEGVRYPYLTYDLNISPSYTKDGISYETVSAVINIYTAFDDYEQKINLTSKVDSALSGIRGNVNGFRIPQVRLNSEEEGAGSNFRVQSLAYNIVVEQ